MKFAGPVGLDTRNILEHFQDVPPNPLNTGIFFSEKSMAVSSIAEKTVERIFKHFLENGGHVTMNNLVHLRDVTVNPLNPGSIYIFHLSMFVNAIS